MTPRSGGYSLAQHEVLGTLWYSDPSPVGTTQTRGLEITDSAPMKPLHLHMSHTYSHNLLHCVFSTKGRLPLIRDPEALWRYTAALAYAKEVHVIAAGGISNHMHLLILLPQTQALARVMQEIKANTSRWLRETSRVFQWQEGYGAFSVSHSQWEMVVRYIAAQPEHHRTRSYEQEFTALLQKSGVEYDPRFIFG